MTELLKIDNVAMEESFFSLGGNSLLAIYLAGRLEKAFHRKVEVVKLFEYPTIRSLAAYLEHGEAEKSFLDEATARAALRKGAIRMRMTE